MIKQFKLFPDKKQMNGFLFKCFVMANGSDYWYEMKEEFYKVKNKVLKRKAIYCGLQMQRVPVRCNSCDGTGRWHYWYYDGGEWCFRCRGTGIFQVRLYYLMKYILNGKVFHIPVGRWYMPQFGDLCTQEVISGRIKHRDYKKAGYYGALILMAVYCPSRFIKYKRKRWKFRILQALQKIYYGYWNFIYERNKKHWKIMRYFFKKQEVRELRYLWSYLRNRRLFGEEKF
jgi:hypothetical protein